MQPRLRPVPSLRVVTSSELLYMSKCYSDFVRIFLQNRIYWGVLSTPTVNYIYIIRQKACFHKITRPLFTWKRPVFMPQTYLFFYWNNGFFVLIRTKKFAHFIMLGHNALIFRRLYLHTKTGCFYGRVTLIFKYRSMRASSKVRV